MKCALCGADFIPKSGRAKYCNRAVERTCTVCGITYTGTCHPKSPTTCNSPECKKKAGAAAIKAPRVCRVCGKSFIPTTSNQCDCGETITKTCVICGAEFESKCGLRWGRNTCYNSDCEKIYAHKKFEDSYMQSTKICVLCGKEFHPRTNTQQICDGVHYRTCKMCGKQFEIVKNPRGNIEDIPVMCSEACKNKARSFPKLTPEILSKIKDTKIAKYGPNYGAVLFDKGRKTYKSVTGYDHPSHNPEVRSKQARSAKISQLEVHTAQLLDNYNIEYVPRYMLTVDGVSHEYDFYIPKYKILVDCDGVYFHAYTSDPDGKHVRDDYDDIRLKLIPKDHIFHLIIEGQETSGINSLVQLIQAQDSNILNYNDQLFTWCRSIEFPYPAYGIERLQRDLKALINYDKLDAYNPNCRLGESIIRNYHHSIYHAHCGNNLSPVEGWYNDDVLKKVIANRLIYVNDVDPSKILRGLYISKLAPRVSIFNPVLTKYLISKYLSKYDTIFDPFSGYSGRLLGAVASDKQYIGQDINPTSVAEANAIIKDMSLENCQVGQKDILLDSGKYSCLLTCPPYGDKEIYGTEVEFKTCDDWISECINRYDCERYVFVVDHTERFADNIIEDISVTSHLTRIQEHIVVIDKCPSSEIGHYKFK